MASKDVIESRIAEIVLLIKEGTRRKDIIRISTLKYGVKEAIVDRYIARAKIVLNDADKRLTESVEAKLQGKMEATQIAIIERQAEIDVLTYIHKRKILKLIATGEYKLTKTIVVDGQAVEIEVSPTHYDVARAIKLDNAMTGDNAPEKHIVAQVPAPLIIDKVNDDPAIKNIPNAEAAGS